MSLIVKEQPSDFTNLLQTVPPGCRPFVIAAALAPTPPPYLDTAFDLPAIRIALAEQWQLVFGNSMPIAQCHWLLGDPITVTAWIELGRFITARTDAELANATDAVLSYLKEETS